MKDERVQRITVIDLAARQKKMAPWWFRLYLWIKKFFREMKARVWNKHILLWWYRLWIRKDSNHISLETDIEAISVMTTEEIKLYEADLVRRREIAYQRDMD